MRISCAAWPMRLARSCRSARVTSSLLAALLLAAPALAADGDPLPSGATNPRIVPTLDRELLVLPLAGEPLPSRPSNLNYAGGLQGQGGGGGQQAGGVFQGGPISNPIYAPVGSSTTPSYSFIGRTGDGFYSPSSGTVMVALGAQNGAMFYQSTSINLGSNGGYTFSLNSDPAGGADTGMFRFGPNQLSFLRGNAPTFIPAKTQTAADFTSAANTNLQLITGLSWTVPSNIQTTFHFDCYLVYSIATAVVAVDFGVQAVTVAPTNWNVSGVQYTSATAVGAATSITGAGTTTATSVTSATPSAITTKWNAELHGLIEAPSNASTSVFQIMVKTAAAADLPTVYRGSYCTVF